MQHICSHMLARMPHAPYPPYPPYLSYPPCAPYASPGQKTTPREASVETTRMPTLPLSLYLLPSFPPSCALRAPRKHIVRETSGDFGGDSDGEMVLDT